MKKHSIWCDHCKALLREANVRSCLRKTCETKATLPPTKKVVFK